MVSSKEQKINSTTKTLKNTNNKIIKSLRFTGGCEKKKNTFWVSKTHWISLKSETVQKITEVWIKNKTLIIRYLSNVTAFVLVLYY